MICQENVHAKPERLGEACEQTRASFSAYLDGALDGRTMGQLAAHLKKCTGCAEEFKACRALQDTLGELGPATVPSELQARLRDTLASEIGTGRHLSPVRRLARFWEQTLLPVGTRLGAGLAAALVILGSASWFLGLALPVQADDDRMAHLNAPKFLYAERTPEPLTTKDGYLAVLVEAKVDADGRVYDFNIMDGPSDPETRLRIEANLLQSVFQPATVFGERVPGHVMMTFVTVSARH